MAASCFRPPLLFLVSLLWLAAMVNPTEAVTNVRIAVNNKRGVAVTMAKWASTFEAYLGRELGPDFNITMIPIPIQQISKAVAAREVDFIFMPPSAVACLESEFELQPIVALETSRKGFALSKFGTVLITSNSSAVKTLADVKGRVFGGISFAGWGGFILGWHQLYKLGLNPFVDCSMLSFSKNQDKTVYDVVSGAVDVGVVRTDQLEGMVSSGKLQLSHVRVLDEVHHPGFPFIASTALYPEWQVGAVAGVANHIVKKVSAALLRLPQYSLPETRDGKYSQFNAPQSLSRAQDVLKDLGIMDPLSGRCKDTQTQVDLDITCPPGHARKPVELRNCSHLACPAGRVCVCRPCFPLCHPEDYWVTTAQASCGAATTRAVTFAWKQAGACYSGVSLPATHVVDCDYIGEDTWFASVLQWALLAACVASVASLAWAFHRLRTLAVHAQHSWAINISLTPAGCLLCLVGLMLQVGGPSLGRCSLMPALLGTGLLLLTVAVTLVVVVEFKRARQKLNLTSQRTLLLQLMRPAALMFLLLLLWLIVPGHRPEAAVHSRAVGPHNDLIADEVCAVTLSPLLLLELLLLAIWQSALLWMSMDVVRRTGGYAVLFPTLLLLLSAATVVATAALESVLPHHLFAITAVRTIVLACVALLSQALSLSRLLAPRRRTRYRKMGKQAVSPSVGHASSHAGRSQRSLMTALADTEADLLGAVMERPVARGLFFEFLDSNLMGESAAFYSAALEFEDLPDGSAEQASAAQDIVARFITQGSPLQVNIPGDVRERIEQQLVLGNVTSVLFARALNIVRQLLVTNGLPKFVPSKQAHLAEQVLDWLDALQASELSKPMIQTICRELGGGAKDPSLARTAAPVTLTVVSPFAGSDAPKAAFE